MATISRAAALDEALDNAFGIRVWLSSQMPTAIAAEPRFQSDSVL